MKLNIIYQPRFYHATGFPVDSYCDKIKSFIFNRIKYCAENGDKQTGQPVREISIQEFDRSFSSQLAVFNGPATTIRNTVNGFRELHTPFTINHPGYETFDVNLVLYIPGSDGFDKLTRSIFFDPTLDLSTFYLHPLVDIRVIYDFLRDNNRPEESTTMAAQCRKAHHLCVSPKQYFRIKNNIRPLYENVYLCPDGTDHELVEFDIPYTQRHEVMLFIKDHNTSYSIEERSQHLKNLLDSYDIRYTLFESHSGKHFNQLDFIEHLKHTKYMVAWDVEETFGHCIHEAKALDVPIFTTTHNGMNYFDQQCGIISTENSLYENFERFLKMVDNQYFTPRKSIQENGLDNISVCANLLHIFSGGQSRFKFSEAGLFQ